MSIIITPIRTATDNAPSWLVGLEGRFQFTRRTPRCVCDVVDQLCAKYPDATVSIVIR